MTKPLVAVVLAGGVGKRFWPLTTDKPMFPFFDRPFLSHLIAKAIPPDVDRLVIITNPRNEKRLNALDIPFPMTAVTQEVPRGMADAILSARTEIQHSRLLIIGGDDVYAKGVLSDILGIANHTDCFGVIPGWITDRNRPLGYLKLDGDRITGLVEKPPVGKEPSRMVNFVAHYIEDSDILLHELQRTKSQTDDVYEKTLTRLMKSETFLLSRYDGPFATLKYPWNVLDVMDVFLHHHLTPTSSEDAVIHPSAIIDGPVVVSPGVRVYEHAKIVGPTYLGPNVVVGNNCIVRESHIGAGTIIGFDTDIARSYVGDNVWFHSNYIGDSVLEGNASLGSGTVLANLRLDEGEIHSMVRGSRTQTGRNKLGGIVGRNVRIGVNVSLMPGVKIGANTMVGAGITVGRDIPDQSYLYLEQNTRIIPSTKAVSDGTRDTFRKKLT